MADKLTSTATLTRQSDLPYLRHVTIDSTANAYGAGTSTVFGNPIGEDSKPAYTPAVERQTCIDVANGNTYEWYSNTWHIVE